MIDKHLPGQHNQKKHSKGRTGSRPDVGSWILSHYNFKLEDIDLITIPMRHRLSGSNESEQKLVDLLESLYSTSKLEILVLDDSSDFSLKIPDAGELAFSVRESKSSGMSLDVNSASDTNNQDLGKVFDHLVVAAQKAGFDLITMDTSHMPIDEAVRRGMDLYKMSNIPRPVSVLSSISKVGHLLQESLEFLKASYDINFSGDADIRSILINKMPRTLEELSNLHHPHHPELGLVTEYLNFASNDYKYVKKLR